MSGFNFNRPFFMKRRLIYRSLADKLARGAKISPRKLCGCSTWQAPRKMPFCVLYRTAYQNNDILESCSWNSGSQTNRTDFRTTSSYCVVKSKVTATRSQVGLNLVFLSFPLRVYKWYCSGGAAANTQSASLRFRNFCSEDQLFGTSGCSIWIAKLGSIREHWLRRLLCLLKCLATSQDKWTLRFPEQFSWHDSTDERLVFIKFLTPYGSDSLTIQVLISSSPWFWICWTIFSTINFVRKCGKINLEPSFLVLYSSI